MKIEEAKKKICPLLMISNSPPECLSDDCMMWYKLSSEFAGENEGVCGLVRKK